MSSGIDSPHTKKSTEGRYVNYFKVGYNADIFIIDYYQIFPVEIETEDKTILPTEAKLRLITSPTDAWQLSAHLKKAIKMYEDAYGHIKPGQNP